MQTHVRIFEISQLEGSYVGDLQYLGEIHIALLYKLKVGIVCITIQMRKIIMGEFLKIAQGH